MPNRSAALKAWLPVLVWMTAIFVGSTDLLSSRNTSQFLTPFLQWLIPEISDEALRQAQHLIRKCGHLTEYAILAVLARGAWHRTAQEPADRWLWTKALAALALAALYALSDEFHQSFVATRTASMFDVLIDTSGAMLGLGLVWIWARAGSIPT